MLTRGLRLCNLWLRGAWSVVVIAIQRYPIDIIELFAISKEPNRPLFAASLMVAQSL